MPKPINEQVNALVGLIIPLGYAAMGYYLIDSASTIAASGVLSEDIAKVLGGLFIGYSLLKLYWAYRKWLRNQEEE
ncbi:hypothetical protein [Siphonobacter curvatus]|uniref:Uncharacterized protein n=1 Tax=Siphonobacter curvatus TaxID=2094562 RepID=A0A2S7ILA7_9BACT|nr:hypothetical protein [Siphonobacter curvatus]PQA58533.1 hypothetical protein C5O19_02355 [Siphonobacter curvatus]